jgi:hypothetical protein
VSFRWGNSNVRALVETTRGQAGAINTVATSSRNHYPRASERFHTRKMDTHTSSSSGPRHSEAMSWTTCPVTERKLAWRLDTRGGDVKSYSKSIRATRSRPITRTEVSVEPRLVTSAVREPTVRAADSNVENKVERYGRTKKEKKMSIFHIGRGDNSPPLHKTRGLHAR